MLRASKSGLLLAVISLCTFAGCGDDGPVRFGVSGKLTNDGAAVPKGYVSFNPGDGNANAPKAVAEVVNGEFSIDSEFGPTEGPYVIQVTVGDPMGLSKDDAMGGKGQTFIPPTDEQGPTGAYEFTQVTVDADNTEFNLELNEAKKATPKQKH